jgi:LAGLIDADG DNA endonuclease family protein
MQHYFGCGTIRPDRSDRTLKWEVTSLPVLNALIIPHFETYPLLSGKRCDFELFAHICGRMEQREHLTPGGLQEIVRMAARTNPSGKRGYSAAEIINELVEMKA